MFRSTIISLVSCFVAMSCTFKASAAEVDPLNCIVARKHMILLEGETIRIVTIATGQSQVLEQRSRHTRISIVDEDGVFAFFSAGHPPLLVDFRTNKKLIFEIFEKNRHECNLVLDDSENIYVFSSVVFGSGLQASNERNLYSKNLSIFPKSKLLACIKSGGDFAPDQNVSTESISGKPIGGRVHTVGELRVAFLALDLHTIKYTSTLLEFKGEKFSVVTEGNLDFGPLD